MVKQTSKENFSENSSYCNTSKGSELTRSTVFKGKCNEAKMKFNAKLLSRTTEIARSKVLQLPKSTSASELAHSPSRVIIDTDYHIDVSCDIDNDEMSQCLHELSFEEPLYKAPAIEEYIGENWVDFEIGSDCDENIMVSNMKCKFSCNLCHRQFKYKFDLQAHELEHEN